MKTKLFFTFLFLSYIFIGHSQMNIGDWKLYPSFQQPTRIIDTKNKVYILADNFLYTYGKEDQHVQSFSKNNGLSDNKINHIAYNYADDYLVITYTNSNIDIMKGNSFYNLPELKEKMLSSSKAINDIYFHNGLIYLATDFGIMVIDYAKKEIKETYFLNTTVNSVTVYKESIYAATKNGIMAARLTDNLLDINNWNIINSLLLKKIVSLPDKILILSQENAISILNTDGTVTFFKNAIDLKVHEDYLLVLLNHNEMVRYSWNLDKLTYKDSFRFDDLDNYSLSSEVFWLVNEKGITSYTIENNENNYISIPVEAPRVNTPYNMLFTDNRLFINTPAPFYTEPDLPGYISVLEENKWINIYPEDVENSMYDLFNIAVSPIDKSIFYVGSWNRGFYKFKNYKFEKRYTKENTPILNRYDGGGAYRIAGMCFDSSNNLWFTNVSSQAGESVVKIMKPDGTWEGLHYNEILNNTSIDRLYIPKYSSSTTKFVLSADNNNTSKALVFAFDEKGTFNKSSDDQHKQLDPFLDQEGNKIDASSYTCIAEDRNGQIWIGTDKGPVIITNPDNVFRDDFTVTRIKVPRNDGTNLADYLLQTETITAIAIDGGNRKWIGTQSTGLYLISGNGLETIHHFTAENSMLPSNTILSLAIHPVTGEVYIGTEGGLVSYRSDATEGSEDYSNVYAFPNPVRPDYTGWITVTGLQENSLVKITDTAGNLFFQDISKGGQVTWNGRGRNGDRVKTGIYLVFASSEDGKSGVVTKIMVVN